MADDTVPSGTFTHGTVTNADAETYGGRNSICQRSGFKARPEDLVQDWTGLWVLPQFRDIRNPQDFQRAHKETVSGSVAPEAPTEEFIAISEPILDELTREIRDDKNGILFSETIQVTL